MIKVVSGGAFRIMIYNDDHHPPHVHVIGSGGQAKVLLSPQSARPILDTVQGLKANDVRKALDLMELHQSMLWDAWRRLHG